MIKEPADTQEFTLAVHNLLALLGIKFSPGDIKRDVRLLGETLKLREQRAIFGFGPGLDRALIQGPGLVRYHQVWIEVDSIAKALAARAGAVRIVEGKEARLGLLVANVALLALKTLRKTQRLRWLIVTRGCFKDDLT